MGLLTRDAILAASDLPTREVAVPEWGGSVRVRTLPIVDREAFEMQKFLSKGLHSTVNLVIACVVDEEGRRLFGPDDVATLEAKGSAAIMRVFAVAFELNGFGIDAVRSAEKNSASGPAAASASGSPLPSAGPSPSSTPA
jgi:hypothetical protein